MNSYLTIENMKLEVMSGFKQSCYNHKIWNHNLGHIYTKYNNTRYKIKVKLTNEQFSTISKLKGEKDISFTYKAKDGKFFTGYINIESILGLSNLKTYKIIQIEISSLELKEAPKDLVRDLLLNEVLG